MGEHEPLILTPRILDYRDPRLRMVAEPACADGELRRLIRALTGALEASRTGVGIAAPQIGIPLQVAVYDTTRDDHETGERGILVNPRILSSGPALVSRSEGCLSAKGLRVDVPRAAAVEVETLDLLGRPTRISASGFLAIVLQHEIDHLQGLTITRFMVPVELAIRRVDGLAGRSGSSRRAATSITSSIGNLSQDPPDMSRT